MNELLRQLLYLPPQASTVARGVDHFHMVVIITSVLGAVGVAAAVALFLIRYGRRREEGRGGMRAAGGRVAHVPFGLEIGVIGGLLALFVTFGVIGFRQFVHLRTPPPGAMEIYVVGKQWMWSYAYPDGSATNHDLYVPVGKPIKLLMTSRDVIHSFWVPAFRQKQDVVPGRMTTLWFEVAEPGTYEVLCAEYCGTQHSTMRGRVIALDAEAYARWSEGRAAPEQDLAAQGERRAAEVGCLRCHTVDGAPHIGPTFAGMFGSQVRLATGQRVVADAAYVTESMMDPEVKIHAGFLPVMPSYRGILQAGDTGWDAVTSPSLRR